MPRVVWLSVAANLFAFGSLWIQLFWVQSARARARKLEKELVDQRRINTSLLFELSLRALPVPGRWRPRIGGRA